MIEGHGDDSYKYSRPITANFSSNVYSRVDLSALKAHLCARIDGIGNYPEPEPYVHTDRESFAVHQISKISQSSSTFLQADSTFSMVA